MSKLEITTNSTYKATWEDATCVPDALGNLIVSRVAPDAEYKVLAVYRQGVWHKAERVD